MASSGITLSPLSLKGISVSNQQQLQQAWFNMCDILNQLVTNVYSPSGIANLLNGQGLLTATAINPLNKNFSTVGVGQTLDCTGATSIWVEVIWTAANLVLTLNNVSYGIPITLLFGNSSGGNSAFGLNMTDAFGNSIGTIQVLQSGQANGATLTAFNGFTYANGNNMILHGALRGPVGSGAAFFSR